VFARSTPKHLRAAPSKRARTLGSRDAEPKSQKKMGATPIFFNRGRTRAAKENYVPSDFMILAVFRDKRKRKAPVQARLASFRMLFGKMRCAEISGRKRTSSFDR
jgi:hypothetical protein